MKLWTYLLIGLALTGCAAEVRPIPENPKPLETWTITNARGQKTRAAWRSEVDETLSVICGGLEVVSVAEGPHQIVVTCQTPYLPNAL